MDERAQIADGIWRTIETVRPGGPPLAELRDETPLGEDGLGLDSVDIVEILLVCEERHGVAIDGLLEGPPLTFGRLVDHFAAG